MPSSRLAALDLARGLAVIAMAIYHFSWDLSWFGFVDWPVARGAGWSSFAKLIAGSFLFLAGVSLDLAHHEAIRWRAFGIRFAKVALAAAGVSLVTWLAFNDSYVRFGILHCIAVSSLLALPFLRLPLLACILAAIIVLSLPLWASSFIFNGQLWLWTGLGTPDYGSVDYVPLAPWTGVLLAGLALSRAFRTLDVWQRLASIQFTNASGRLTRLLGRHSLPIYLIHQPLFYGLVWSLTLLGPQTDRASIAFVESCTESCRDTFGTAEICDAACGCTLDHLKADDIWTRLNEEPQNQALLNRMNNHHAQCLADPDRKPLIPPKTAG